MNFATFKNIDLMSNDDDPELKRLRMQRLQKIMQQKQQAEARAHHTSPTTEDKVEMLLHVLLTPPAKQYLEQIKQNKNSVYLKIRQQLFPPQVMYELDLLMSYYTRGMIRQGVISLTEIRYFERKALGIGSSITIKKQGEDAKSLGDFLKDEE